MNIRTDLTMDMMGDVQWPVSSPRFQKTDLFYYGIALLTSVVIITLGMVDPPRPEKTQLSGYLDEIVGHMGAMEGSLLRWGTLDLSE